MPPSTALRRRLLANPAALLLGLVFGTSALGFVGGASVSSFLGGPSKNGPLPAQATSSSGNLATPSSVRRPPSRPSSGKVSEGGGRLSFELADPELLPALNQAFAGKLWRLDYDGAVNRSALTGLRGTYRVAAKYYEDLPPEGLVDLLEKASFSVGERFYDLGAGPGKTIALAWMLGLNASGVELSEQRVEGACAAFRKLANSPWALRHRRSKANPSEGVGELAISAGSFTNFDFSDGDLVLMDLPNVPEMYWMLAQVAPTALKMRKNSRIVSQVQLPLPNGRRVVSECRRPKDDRYEAAARDERLKKYLCGATYFIYTMPGPPQDNQASEEEVVLAPAADPTAPKVQREKCRL